MLQLLIIIIYQINNIYILSLLSNLENILIPVDAISIILGIFYPFSPSKYGIPLVALYNFWAKWTFLKFYVFQTPLEFGRSITSEAGTLLLEGLSCTYVMDYDDVIVLLLFSGKRLACDLGFLWDINQYLEWTKCPRGQYSLVHRLLIYVAQYMYNLGVLWLPSWMGLWEIHHQTPHEIEVIHKKLPNL